MGKIFSVLLVLFLGTTSYAASADVYKLLDRMIVTYGGAEALQKANDYTQEWEVTAMVRNEKGTDRRKVSLPGELYTDIVYPSRSETRILKDGKGIKITDETNTRVATGPMLDAMKLQLMRLYNPLTLKAHAGALTLSGNDTEKILSLSHEGLRCDYYVDPSTLFITKVIGTLSMGGQSMQFLTEYKAHKVVNGIVMPHNEIKYAGSVNTAVLSLKSVSFTPVQTAQTIAKNAI